MNGNGGWCRHQPPLSQAAARAGEGAGVLLGRFRPEPFGPGRFLGFQTKPCGSSGSLTGFPPKSCDFAGFPVWVPRNIAASSAPFADPHPKAWACRTSEESGFGLRLALLPQPPVQRFGERTFLRMTPLPQWSKPRAALRCRRASQRPRTSFLTENSESRQGESLESRLWIKGNLWITRRRRDFPDAHP
jgi:hypothetical protein